MTSYPPAKHGVDRAQIIKAAGSVGVLGTGALTAPRIMAALCEPDVSLSRITALVRNDPTLSLRVLRVANSAYYGRPRSITNLERALGLLGMDAVRGIAVSACLDRVVVRGDQHALEDMRALIHHSQATAAAAESLARVRHPSLISEAFITGLLHNLGTALQMYLDASGIEAMIGLRRQDDVRDIRALELERATVTHEECGAIIFEGWQLPESVIAATRHHHDPMAAPDAHRELAALINLGSNLALAAGCTFMLEPVSVARNSAAMAWLGLDERDLDSVAAALPERIAVLKQALWDV